jgi:uncharacterized Ntn-hydrolase superfamily protein
LRRGTVASDVTFSICVRETDTDETGEEQTRFGVAVTTRLPAVGTLCPFASENGAVATQSLVNVELGRRGVEYLDDGLAVEDALQALLNADEGREQRQLHGVDAEGTFAFSGAECQGWFGHRVGENYTVAGNLLTGESVLDATAAAYESGLAGGDGGSGDRDESDGGGSGARADGENGDGGDGGEDTLAKRLIDALEAGHEAGGDKREELEVQSAALLVTTTAEEAPRPYYDDLRVDATRTPIADLRETYELAKEGYETAVAKYQDGE